MAQGRLAQELHVISFALIQGRLLGLKDKTQKRQLVYNPDINLEVQHQFVERILHLVYSNQVVFLALY